MTREEKIEILEKEKAYMLSHGGDRQAEALDSAIKAIEQEPILDKIIAEIEDTEIKGYIRDVECFNAGIRHALIVIDKYKAESENEK